MTHRLPGGVLDDREYLSDYIKRSFFSELVREVEIQLNNPVEDGNPFCFKNQVPVTLLAARLASILANLDATPHHDDLLNAINDEEFSGLKRLSWGLLLSDRFRPRFTWLIKKYQDRRLNPHGPDPSLRVWSSNGVAHSGHRLLLDPMDGYPGPASTSKIRHETPGDQRGQQDEAVRPTGSEGHVRPAGRPDRGRPGCRL